MGATTSTISYSQWRDHRQEEFNNLPIYWAFSDDQFKRVCEEQNFTADDLVQPDWLGGGFCRKTDLDRIKEWASQSDGLSELMSDADFAVDAFYYEMCNHEYGINYYQGDWDVITCFVQPEPEYHERYGYKEYLTAAGHEDWIPAYIKARQKYFHDAEENEWF